MKDVKRFRNPARLCFHLGDVSSRKVYKPSMFHCLIAFLFLLLPVSASAKPGEVLLQFPSPGPSPYGLAWDGNHLWVADDETDKIYRLDPANGKILQSITSVGPATRGLAHDGTHLWILDNESRKIVGFDPASKSVISTLDAPTIHYRDGFSPLGGLAWDGDQIWAGRIAGWSSGMTLLDPVDGTEREFKFTKGVPQGLAARGDLLWSASDNGGIRRGIIYVYSKEKGVCVSHFDTPGDYPTGLAFDGEWIWCVDRGNRMIYKMTAR